MRWLPGGEVLQQELLGVLSQEGLLLEVDQRGRDSEEAREAVIIVDIRCTDCTDWLPSGQWKFSNHNLMLYLFSDIN